MADFKGYWGPTRFAQDRRVLEYMSWEFKWADVDLKKRFKQYKVERTASKKNSAKEKRQQKFSEFQAELKKANLKASKSLDYWFTEDVNVLRHLSSGKNVDRDSYSLTKVEKYILDGIEWLKNPSKDELKELGDEEEAREKYGEHVDDVEAIFAPVRRHNALVAALNAADCVLRSDSTLSSQYIKRGEGSIAHIVEKMVEMKFLHEKTN